MMNDAWESKSLAASSFFNLGAPVAIVLTIVMWICGLISKIFAYFRAGMLPILVGVAPMWAAMSWMETGKQAFAKTIGWLAAFLAYKPRRRTGHGDRLGDHGHGRGPGDDSQAITLMLTLSVIILLPAMIRVIVPAVQSSVGGGGGGILPPYSAWESPWPAAACASMGGKGGRERRRQRWRRSVTGRAKPGAGRGLAGLLSGLGRGDGKPQGTNGGGRHAKPLEGNPTGGEPQNTGRPATGSEPQGQRRQTAGERTAMAREARFHRHPMAPPDPSGGNRPQGTNDAGGFAREGAPDGADRSSTRKGKTF